MMSLLSGVPTPHCLLARSIIDSIGSVSELQDPVALEAGHLQPIHNRIDALKASRPYASGGRPFVEDRLSAEW
jgi:hypothetical protein